VKLVSLVTISRVLRYVQLQEQNVSKMGCKQPIWKRVMSCRNLLNHGDILLQKSQKEFIIMICGEVSLSFIGK
jgi:hypothetical protein